MTPSMPFRCLNTHLVVLIKCDPLIIFEQAIARNECKYKQLVYFFSDVHGAMNHSGSLGKLA